MGQICLLKELYDWIISLKMTKYWTCLSVYIRNGPNNHHFPFFQLWYRSRIWLPAKQLALFGFLLIMSVCLQQSPRKQVLFMWQHIKSTHSSATSIPAEAVLSGSDLPSSGRQEVNPTIKPRSSALMGECKSKKSRLKAGSQPCNHSRGNRKKSSKTDKRSAWHLFIQYHFTDKSKHPSWTWFFKQRDFLFVCFFNDISRLFSAIFGATALCKFAAMLFILTFVPAGKDEWNFPSHHSFFGLFLKEVAFKLCAHCGNPATVGWLFSVNQTWSYAVKHHWVRMKKFPLACYLQQVNKISDT